MAILHNYIRSYNTIGEKQQHLNKTIKQIFESTNIVDLIGETTSLTKEGSVFFGLCPFHKETSASFMVDPAKRQFHCYGCGAGGNAYSFVMQRDNCTFKEAVAKLAVRAGLPVPENIEDEDEERKKTRMYQINELAYAFFYQKGRGSEEATKYLKETRGLSDETIKRFGLGKAAGFGQELYHYLKTKGYTNEEMMESGLIGYGEVYAGNNSKKQDYFDRFWDRIMFPIFNQSKKIVGFGGRILGDGKPKYLNSPETVVFDKSHELYGLHIAKTCAKPFVLCEGYLDVISMHQAGFKTAIASLGTSLTYAQARMIAECTNTVFIAYDSDEAGIKASVRAIPMLESFGLRVFVVSTAPYKDVDELLKADDSNYSDMKRRINAAVPGKTFLTRQFDKSNTSFYDNVASII